MLVSIGTLWYLAYVIVVRCVLLQVVLGKDWLRMVRSTVNRVVKDHRALDGEEQCALGGAEQHALTGEEHCALAGM